MYTIVYHSRNILLYKTINNRVVLTDDMPLKLVIQLQRPVLLPITLIISISHNHLPLSLSNRLQCHILFPSHRRNFIAVIMVKSSLNNNNVCLEALCFPWINRVIFATKVNIRLRKYMLNISCVDHPSSGEDRLTVGLTLHMLTWEQVCVFINPRFHIKISYGCSGLFRKLYA